MVNNFPKLGELNVLYAGVAKGKYLCHICPCSVRCLVKMLDKDLIPCSALGRLMFIWSYSFNFDAKLPK